MSISNEILEDIYKVQYIKEFAKYKIIITLKSRNILGFRKKVVLKYPYKITDGKTKGDEITLYTEVDNAFYYDKQVIEKYLYNQHKKVINV